jgi:D-3-phosphoglycerate dehydrogenase
MMAQRILVTPRSLTAEPHPHIESLRNSGFEIVYSTPGKTPDEDELVRLIGDVSGWLAGVEPVSPRVIEAARSLKAISRNGVGTDNLPVELLTERGIKVLIAEGANSLGVAELAIGLIFSALRSIPQADTGIKAGGWPRQRGIEIRGRTVGVLGCGAIGREVARMLVAVGAKVLGYDPLKPDLGLPADKFSFAEVDDIIAQADIVTLHCPAPRDGSTLISRAKLVDDQAIIDALNSGQLSNYATDVFEQEPPLSLDLASHPAVIATSHIGGFTAESVDRATKIAADNLVAALKN